MNQSRKRIDSGQWRSTRGALVVGAIALAGCAESRVVGPGPDPNNGSVHPGFDTSLYPGDAAMRAWLAPASPYEWVGYYLQAPCHRDPSWMGKRATLTSMGWGLAVLFVGQQTFDGQPDVLSPIAPGRTLLAPDSPVRARVGVVTPSSGAEMQSGAVTCSRTLLTSEQGATDAIDAVTKTAAEGFAGGTVIYLDIEHMDAIPASMESYYRAWVQQVLADGRFRPGVYVHQANAQSIHDGVARAYADMNRSGTAVFWVTGSNGFSIDKSPHEVGFPWASIWQGQYEVDQTYNGATINIDVDVAAMKSPSNP